MSILITGGAGYIGSHTVVELQNAGYSVVVVDNFSNSFPEALRRVEKITGKRVPFYKADIRDRSAMEEIFRKEKFECCIHFAGFKAVGQSVTAPWEYYDNNINGTLALIDVMRKYRTKNMIFSSSATVYGKPAFVPITEDCPKGKIVNPYGRTKSMQEEILADIQKADPEWNVILLRYFNPIGAHISGLIGESPVGIPGNLVPYIAQVAVRRLEKLLIYGNDYHTRDGTGIRDYIHVSDLAVGHVKALEAVRQNPGLEIYNLGTGKGYSVLEVVRCFEQVSGVPIPCQVVSRRPGDIAVCYADAGKAERELKWKTTRSLADMCLDSWRWQLGNPNGYHDACS
ncbi:UDP-glucose 4-epimerase [Syntrophobotulus glycolicus DSM 8271]|uniref:UDP-glucose 4-epimerase n=1 Tax=Syntrophobotulus glycolicus (strain DSM 8271 / FlGlyR) TaxID=645991 RepID=F0SX25_SYNGF|nr:UDP-glucose 4-epimerase GalE [Syntrophobotulus glycolicus]ADY55808.1 UDP-glucose 4-epimerase [Syntrophobotulus glycolicus DSM 8271]